MRVPFGIKLERAFGAHIQVEISSADRFSGICTKHGQTAEISGNWLHIGREAKTRPKHWSTPFHGTRKIALEPVGVKKRKMPSFSRFAKMTVYTGTELGSPAFV